MANDHQRRNRRIHLEGAPDEWRHSRPVRDLAPRTPPGSGRTGPAVETTPRLDHEGAAARLQKAITTARQQTSDLVVQLDALEQGFSRCRGPELADATDALAAARRRSASDRVERLAQLDHEGTSKATALDAALQQAVRALAPGPASADWTLLATVSDQPLPARYLRFGTMVGADGRPIAALAPFLGSAGWSIEGPAPVVDGLVLGTLVRTIAQSPLSRLEITVYDPRARGPLGSLMGVRNVVPSALPAPLVDPGSLSDRLRVILADVAADTESLVARRIPDLVTEWRSTPTPETTQHIVVLFDYPYAIDDAVDQLLERVEQTAGPVRPLLLVVGGNGQRSETTRWSEDRLIRMTGEQGRWTTTAAAFPQSIDADPPPPPAVVTQILEEATARERGHAGPTIDLEELLADDLAAPWSHSSHDSLDLTFGRSPSGQLGLSLRSANPPHPNMLIGGAVGQGKSNLLLDIIYGLAVRYSPAELQFHLLDFKEGLEFARFGPDATGAGWLPHVRSLSLESDRAFGTEVLRHVAGEMDRRADRFKAAGQVSNAAYRQATGDAMPRIVLVIDEFHELLSGDDGLAREAVALLEKIARKGRAYGLHLLLASQTLSGIQALAAKEDSIFAQFPIRLSLKNTATESQSILERGNTAAADLTHRGEVVLNCDFGRRPANQVGLAAYARPDHLAEVQRQLWGLGRSEPPMVFVASELAPWPSQRPPEGSAASVPLWVGRPLGVEDEPRCHVLLDDADQAVAVIGGDRGLNRRVLQSMVVTGLAGITGGDLVVLDGDGEEADSWHDSIGDTARGLGVSLRYIPRGEAAVFLRTEVDERLRREGEVRPLLLVGLSVQRLRAMTDASTNLDAGDDQIFGFDDTTGRTVLQQVAQRGANQGVFLIASWTNLRNAEADLGPGLPGVRAVATCAMGVEDLRTLVGPHVDPIVGDRRVGFYDRSGDGELEVLIPYASPRGA